MESKPALRVVELISGVVSECRAVGLPAAVVSRVADGSLLFQKWRSGVMEVPSRGLQQKGMSASSDLINTSITESFDCPDD